MAEWYSIVSIDHIFFICLSVEGDLGSFNRMAIVDIAATNTGVHMALLSSKIELAYDPAIALPSIDLKDTDVVKRIRYC